MEQIRIPVNELSPKADSVENALDRADKQAESSAERLNHEEVFSVIRNRKNTESVNLQQD